MPLELRPQERYRNFVASMLPLDTPSICLRSAQLRSQSRTLAARMVVATIQLRPLTDGAVLARTEARRLRAEASRLDELSRQTLILEARWLLPALDELALDSGETFVDGEIFEDEELLAPLNAMGYRCDKCGGEESLVAVVRFGTLSETLGICADCYRGLSGLALGQVM
jgi:hypothetical protein